MPGEGGPVDTPTALALTGESLVSKHVRLSVAVTEQAVTES